MTRKHPHIHLIQQKGFSWHLSDNVRFKGYFFNPEGSYYEGEQAAGFFRDVCQAGELQDRLKQLNGLFSVIIDTPSGMLLGTDPLGLFSLFYALPDGNWKVSDSSGKLAEMREPSAVNEAVMPAFLSAGFVPGKQTLYQDVFRCRPGEILQLKPEGEAISHTYHLYIDPDESDENEAGLRQSLLRVLQNSNKRLLRFLNGRTAVIPLSGGYDSRLILAMLKSVGYEKVICFTYGAWNKETAISKEMAEKAGYPWHFVDYTKVDSTGFSHTRQFQDYCELAGNGFAMPYLQEYFAVKHLKEQELVPDDAVFLPGHPGDFLAGKQLGKLNRNTKTGKTIREIRRAYFNFIPLKATDKRSISGQIAQELHPIMEACRLSPKKSYQYMEAWDLKEKRSKFICQSALVFPFFGNAFYFPLWDKEIRDFFRKVPLAFRIRKKLYDQVLEECFFKPLHLCSEKDDGNKVSRLMLLRFHLSSMLRPYLPFSIIKRRMQRNDWICYERFSREMLQERSQDQWQPKPGGRYYSYNALICLWYATHLNEKANKKDDA